VATQGIGRAVAVIYAREGADVAISYLPSEQRDADETRKAVERENRRCLLLPGDLTDAEYCRQLVEQTVGELGKLDILVSNAAHQNRKDKLTDLTDEELMETFETNVYAYMRLCRAALPKMKRGGVIIATSSQTGILGRASCPTTRQPRARSTHSPSRSPRTWSKKGSASTPSPRDRYGRRSIRPTPGCRRKRWRRFGAHSPMGRPAQPEELAPAYVFLASNADSSYITGTVLQVMGGETSGG
jgi:NAD(P)-dependent dehydrogenase (short-subunit alcohol dehydrogenase family)